MYLIVIVRSQDKSVVESVAVQPNCSGRLSSTLPTLIGHTLCAASVLLHGRFGSLEPWHDAKQDFSRPVSDGSKAERLRY